MVYFMVNFIKRHIYIPKLKYFDLKIHREYLKNIMQEVNNHTKYDNNRQKWSILLVWVLA